MSIKKILNRLCMWRQDWLIKRSSSRNDEISIFQNWMSVEKPNRSSLTMFKLYSSYSECFEKLFEIHGISSICLQKYPFSEFMSFIVVNGKSVLALKECANYNRTCYFFKNSTFFVIYLKIDAKWIRNCRFVAIKR